MTRFPTVLLLFASIFIKGQTVDYPKNYFIPPLDTPLVLSGTFGEIRPNHFHSGIDIGTGEMEGMPVVAAADGYISRIKIAPDGFGKALYVTHPNGFVTVYGHLQKFTGAVNEYVRNEQYKRLSFAVDLKPKEREFKVKQGEIIAYSGNTGGTSGPHLHFEIRDEETEEPINPFLFGLPLTDHIPPTISHVKIYPWPESGIVNKTDTPVTFEVQAMDGINTLNAMENPQGYGLVAFGFEAYDGQDNSTSQLGIYSAELYVNGTLSYMWKMDRFNFNDTRYVNAHADYESINRDRINIQRMFRLPGNRLGFYLDTTVTGLQHFTEDEANDILIVVKDFKGNTASISFPLLTYSSLADMPYQQRPAGAIRVTNTKGAAIHKDDVQFVIPEHSVYHDAWITDGSRKGSGFLSDVYRLGDPYIALQVPVSVKIKPSVEIPDSLKSKVFVARLERNGTFTNCGSKRDGALIGGESLKFGEFALMYDTVPPKVYKEYVPADMNSYRGGIIQVKIRDDVSGIKSYSGTIDGKWVLFEYDMKSDMVTADLSTFLQNKMHVVELTVTDGQGNTTIWKSEFYY